MSSPLKVHTNTLQQIPSDKIYAVGVASTKLVQRVVKFLILMEAFFLYSERSILLF